MTPPGARFCRELIVKFKQGVGFNDQCITPRECEGCDTLRVWREGDELKVAFYSGKTVQGVTGVSPSPEQVCRKTVSWNFTHVVEYACGQILTQP